MWGKYAEIFSPITIFTSDEDLKELDLHRERKELKAVLSDTEKGHP
jgi:hypothetical protein